MAKMKSRISHLISFLLHGETKPLYANITYLKPNIRLKGKRIIVTGGGRGLGYAMAKRFVEEDAVVLIAGRNEETLIKSSAEIGCEYLKLDVQDIESFPSFYDKAEKLIGKINCLVNNAGISLHENSILEVSREQFDTQINTNFRGPFFMAQEFLKRYGVYEPNNMKKIIFVSSETGITVDERPYGLTKAAINSLVQGLAHKYVNRGIRVNAIAPGVTISDMVGKENDGNLTCGGFTGRYYLPEEVAEVACFLISDVSNCLNGQILVSNEGKTINARWR